MHLTILGLVLANVAPNVVGKWEPGIPTGWEDVPSDMTGFEKTTTKDGSIIFTADPWTYAGRLGLYKTLLGATTTLHWDDGWGNPLWGLPLQFSWQHDTGRLLDGSGSSGGGGSGGATGIVNTSSWWGGMNYFLSVVPFVAAVDAGIFANALPRDAAFNIRRPPPDAHKGTVFCVDFSSCAIVAPNATAAWRTFFGHAVNGSLDTPAKAVEYLWRAHVHSLHEGIPQTEPLLKLLPSKAEADFGLGWANLVDFVAAMQYDVDYNQTNTMQGLVVPPRMLTDADKPPHIKDFTGRVDAQKALIGFLADPKHDVGAILKLLLDLIKAHPCPPLSSALK
eukprot:gene8929-35408_t